MGLPTVNRFLRSYLLCLLAIFGPPASAFWQSRDSNYNISTGGGGASYTGPGDIAAATNWYGLRAYSAATRGANLFRVCDTSTGLTCSNVASDGTTGKINVSAVNALTQCSVSCSIVTMFDQVGGKDVTQATISLAPLWNGTGGPTGFGAARFNAANMDWTNGAYPTLSVPFTMICTVAASSFGAASAQQSMVLSNNLQLGLFNNAGTDQVFVFDGGGASDKKTIGGTPTAFHNYAGTVVGSNGIAYADGSASGAGTNVGSGNTNGTLTMMGGSGLSHIDSEFEECGIWNSDQTTNLSTFSSNAQSFYGY